MATIKTATDIKAKARIVPSPFAVIPKADEATDDIDPPKKKNYRTVSGMKQPRAIRRSRRKQKKKKLTLTKAFVIQRGDEGLGERAVTTTSVEPPIGA